MHGVSSSHPLGPSVFPATMKALLLLPLLPLVSATVAQPTTTPSCTAYTQALELMHSLERTTERGGARNIASGKGGSVGKADVWAMVWSGRQGGQTVSCNEPGSGGRAASQGDDAAPYHWLPALRKAKDASSHSRHALAHISS